MTTNKKMAGTSNHRNHWAWLLPILALAPLSLAAKGCNSAVVGDDCPEGADCTSNGNGGAASQSPAYCGGLQGLACEPREYCVYSPEAMCGAGDQTGVCKPKPEVCADIYSPVCGCDDKTYGNECEAAGAGVSVIRRGKCDAPQATCGGLQGLDCPVGEYCNYPQAAQCGAADQTGVCSPKPEVCDDIYQAVCGCDDKTYSNQCEAAGAGVSVVHEGECKPPVGGGETCGGLLGLGCKPDQYCNYPLETKCGSGDQTGTCTDIRKDVACTLQYDPVCGCDGTTYGNACAADLAGVSIASVGECGAPTGEVCGGFRGAQCEKGQYCKYPVGGDCGFADGTGNCEVTPDVCTKEFAPVCGCDGKTYENACAAAAAGASVATVGACK